MKKRKLTIIFLVILLLSISGCSSQVTFGNVDVETVGFTLSVDKETSKPGKVQTTFSKDDTRIYYCAKIKYLPGNSELKYSWYFGDQLINEGSLSVTEEVEGKYFNTYMDAIDGNKWPEGKYKVVVTGIRNGKQILKITDQFKIKK